MVGIRADGATKVNGSVGTVHAWALREARPHSTCSFLNMATTRGTGGKNYTAHLLDFPYNVKEFVGFFLVVIIFHNYLPDFKHNSMCICPQPSPTVPTTYSAEATVLNRPWPCGSVSAHRPHAAGQRQRSHNSATQTRLWGPSCRRGLGIMIIMMCS